MKTAVYNLQGKETGEVTLPKEVFEVAMNKDLVHQVLLAQRGNMRQGSAHTKNRGEVRGGGRKPWRQKGTGRARHGSTRSPIWTGGGISGGPRNDENYLKDLPKKMRRKALCMVLSEKAKNNLVVVVEAVAMEKPKTKMVADMIKKLPAGKASRLMLYTSADGKMYLAARNIAKTAVLEARNTNIVDLLNHKYVVISKDAVKEIESTLTKN